MRSLAILLPSAIACNAQPICNGVICTGISTGTWVTTSSNVAVCGGQDECTQQDLVIRSRDGKTILIRKITGCATAVSKLKMSDDVVSADCFK